MQGETSVSRALCFAKMHMLHKTQMYSRIQTIPPEQLLISCEHACVLLLTVWLVFFDNLAPIISYIISRYHGCEAVQILVLRNSRTGCTYYNLL